MGRKDRIPDWQFRQIVDAIQEEQQGVRSGHGATRGATRGQVWTSDRNGVASITALA